MLYLVAHGLRERPLVRGGLYVGVLLWYGVAGSQCRVVGVCVWEGRWRCGLLGGTGSHPA